MKIPLITAYSPAVSELIKDGESCIFVRRADPAHLAEKISFLADNPEVGNRLADNARSIYEKKCSTEVLMAELFDIIKKQ